MKGVVKLLKHVLKRILMVLTTLSVLGIIPLALIWWADYQNKELLVKTENKQCAFPPAEINNLKTSTSQKVKKNGIEITFITFKNHQTQNDITAIIANNKYLGFASLDIGGQKTPTRKPIVATLNQCLVYTTDKYEFWYEITGLGINGSNQELEDSRGQIQITSNTGSSTFPVTTVQIGKNATPTLLLDIIGKDD
jgi:hypothetical protein